MPNRKDAIAAAELAALVGGSLHEVDAKRLDGGDAVQMHPRDFLPAAPTQNRQTTNNVIPQHAVIEEPKSKPAGSQVVGTETVNMENIMIPMDGADKNMQEMLRAHSNPTQPTQPAPPQPKAEMTPGTNNTVPMVPATPQPNNEIVELLKSIDGKLDLLLKRAKIQPRYKKKK